jgi:hypothetical protein
MRKFLPVMALALGLSACATPRTGDGGILYNYAQERKLAAAVELQKEGNLSSAIKSLAALCAEPGVPGVTDEALFRLSLLYLKNGLENDKGAPQMAQQSIERLRKEYPSSSWTGMAAPLVELLAATTELRRQNRTLKNQNQSLSRENQSLSREAQELRQNIEKLKRLDLELEQRNK